MEKKNDRVLAYTLAKELSKQDLNEVSGGKFACKTPSGYATSEGRWDFGIDFRLDW